MTQFIEILEQLQKLHERNRVYQKFINFDLLVVNIDDALEMAHLLRELGFTKTRLYKGVWQMKHPDNPNHLGIVRIDATHKLVKQGTFLHYKRPPYMFELRRPRIHIQDDIAYRPFIRFGRHF